MFDVITVGSATIDIFVDTKKKLFRDHIPFGKKILIDKLHIDTGGSASNTAVAFSHLGLKTACLIKVGRDSEKIFEVLKKENVDTSLIVKDDNLLTDHSIILDATGQDRTILVYKDASKKLSWGEIDSERLKTRWFYLGTMIGKSYEVLEKIVDLGAKVALNTSQYLAKKKPLKLLDKTDILIVNKEEAELLCHSEGAERPKNPLSKRMGSFADAQDDGMLQKLHQLGPKIVVITDKDREIKAFDGQKEYSIVPHKEIKSLERTGAGDAFAASFVAGMIKKNDIDFALKLALANSESVIQHYGAKNKLLRWDEACKSIKS